MENVNKENVNKENVNKENVSRTSSSISSSKNWINTPWTPTEEQRIKIMRDVGASWDKIAKVIEEEHLLCENLRLTHQRPSLIGAKELLRNIGIRYRARDQSFDGRLTALQDMHNADFAEDDVSFANTVLSKENDL